MSDGLPPWEPIAKWLARRDDDRDSNPFMTVNDARIYGDYEKAAKAIAYDIGTHDDAPTPKRNAPVEVCPKCEGHGGPVPDPCDRCGGKGRLDE